MIGDATNTHLDKIGNTYMLHTGAPASSNVVAQAFKPGPEADPILRQLPLHLGYGLSRNDLIDVMVRLLNTNVVVDPAVMESANCQRACCSAKPSQLRRTACGARSARGTEG